jgi:hypothetical protein
LPTLLGIGQTKPVDLPAETDSGNFDGSRGYFLASGVAAHHTIPFATVPVTDSAELVAVKNALTSAGTLFLAGEPEDFFTIQGGLYANSARAGLKRPVGQEWRSDAPGSTLPPDKTPLQLREPHDERPVTYVWYDPESTAVSGSVNGRFRISGHASRAWNITPKHSFRLIMKDAFGVAGQPGANLFGPSPLATAPAGGYKTFDLRNPSQDSWSVSNFWTGERDDAKYITDNFATRLLKHIRSHPVPAGSTTLVHPEHHRRFIHVFLNGLYWGIYEMMEHIDEDWARNRVDPPTPTAQYDIVTASDDSGGLVAGDRVAWNAVTSSAIALVAAAKQGQVGTVSTLYDDLATKVDLFSLADYILMNLWIINNDWRSHNYITVRRRPATPTTPADSYNRFQFLSWDAEFALYGNENAAHPVAENNTGGPGELSLPSMDSPYVLHHRMCYSAAYLALFKARLEALTVAGTGKLLALTTPWEQALSALGGASPSAPNIIPAESIRWGQTYWTETSANNAGRYKKSHWEANVNSILTTVIPNRTTHLKTHLTNFIAGQTDLLELYQSFGSGGGSFTTSGGITPAGAVAEANWDDTDQDGMPDWWERGNQLVVGLNDGFADKDGDGISNLVEYLFGSAAHLATSKTPSTAVARHLYTSGILDLWTDYRAFFVP